MAVQAQPNTIGESSLGGTLEGFTQVVDTEYNIDCTCVPPTVQKHPAVFGRTEVLEAIDKAFFPNELPETAADLANTVSVKTFVIHGAGGIGKTQAAAEFVSTRSSRFEVILWVTAEPRIKLLDGYRKFAVDLGLVSGDEDVGDDVILSYVRGWLAKPTKSRSKLDGPFYRWLLVMDDLNHPDEMLQDDWPYDGCGCVLITGREPSLRTSARFGTAGIALPPLTLDDAVVMLLELCNKRGEDIESARKIVSEWSGFPLSILCVAGIIQTNGLSLAECATYKAGKRREALSSEWRFAMSHYNLASIWALESLNAAENTVLKVVSLLDSEAIQGSIFTTTPLPDEVFALKDFPGVAETPDFVQARTTL